MGCFGGALGDGLNSGVAGGLTPALPYWLSIEIWELLAQVLYFRCVIEEYVRIFRVLGGVVLVIVFGGVESGIGI
jgi:hypothetical protein